MQSLTKNASHTRMRHWAISKADDLSTSLLEKEKIKVDWQIAK